MAHDSPKISPILLTALLAGLLAACGPDGELQTDSDNGSGPEHATEASDRQDESLAFIDIREAMEFPGSDAKGEFRGLVYDEATGDSVRAGLQVAVYGPHRYRGLFYSGGLPGEGAGAFRPEQTIELSGEKRDGRLVLRAVEEDETLRIQRIHGTFTLLDADRNYLGHLERVERSSSVEGLEPPEGATLLFSGREADLEHWDEQTRMDGELLMQGATTRQEYGDLRLHLEAKLGFMPNAPDQRRTNSGIYIQNRYEVQILDSFALPVAVNGNASLYNEVAPSVNMSFPPLQWQTYDVWFRAPRINDAGEKLEDARVTVFLNGVRVIDDESLERGTGRGGERKEVSEAELYLQDHTGPVRFRNIWIEEGVYDPPRTDRLSPF